MKNIKIILKDHTYDLIAEVSSLRGKPLSHTVEDLLSEYFESKHKKKLKDVLVTFDESEEIWKDIPGYEGLYQASNMGRIASIRYGFKIRSCVKNTTGYLQVAFRINGKLKTYLVHILIAKTFLNSCQNRNQVDHINNVKFDNRVSNLQWVTRSENMKNNYLRDDAASEKLRARGKKLELFNKHGKSLGVFNKILDAAKFLNTSSGNVSSLCNPNSNVKSLTKEKITGKYI
jgi:hypothetical protein